MRVIQVLLLALLVFLFLFTGFYMSCAQTNMGPIRTPQINTNLYVGQSGYATIQSAVTFACRTGNQSFAVYIPPGATPSDTPTAVTGGCSGTYIADLRGMPLRYYTWTGTAYVLTVSETGIAHTLNLLTGDGNGNALDSTIPASDVARLSATINNFTGPIHTAAGSQVNNSPICTEATGCPGTNVTYPPAGIGVSTGTAWSPSSIDPALLATWPPAGIPVSTGTAWASSISPTALPAPGTNQQVLFNNNGVIAASASMVNGNDLNVPGILHALTANIDGQLTTYNATVLNTLTTTTVNASGAITGFNVIANNNLTAQNVNASGAITGFNVIANNNLTAQNVNAAGGVTGFNVTANNELIAGSASVSNYLFANSFIYAFANLEPDYTDVSALSGGGMYVIANGAVNAPPIGDARQLYIFVFPSQYAGRFTQIAWGYNDTSETFYTRQLRDEGWSSWHPIQTPLSIAATLPGTLHRQSAGTVSKTAPIPRPSTPKSSHDSCSAGAIWNDARYIYVCVKTGQIKRAALTAF